MPCTRTPRAASGNATRPVPIAELERRAIAGERGEEVDRRAEDLVAEHEAAVVTRRDLFTEIVLPHRTGRYPPGDLLLAPEHQRGFALEIHERLAADVDRDPFHRAAGEAVRRLARVVVGHRLAVVAPDVQA